MNTLHNRTIPTSASSPAINPNLTNQSQIKNKSFFSNFSSNIGISKFNAELDDIKIQIYFSGVITVIYLKDESSDGTGKVELEKLFKQIRNICKFDNTQPFTLKWVDEEGDPCTISSQIELDEAIRLYYLNKESELIVHVFANLPERPGTQCTGEDRSIYRRGARRWRKIYLVNGHKYQAKRFARTALCKVCQDRIWGLGRQGYKCLQCKIMVHKRCHKFIMLECNEIMMNQMMQSRSNYQSSNSNHSQLSPLVYNNLNSNNNATPNNHDLNMIKNLTPSATISSISSGVSPDKNDSSLRLAKKIIDCRIKIIHLMDI